MRGSTKLKGNGFVHYACFGTAHRKENAGTIGAIREMKPEMTKEQIIAAVSRLRCEYEMMKKKTRELGGRTSRLYIALENIRPDPVAKDHGE